MTIDVAQAAVPDQRFNRNTGICLYFLIRNILYRINFGFITGIRFVDFREGLANNAYVLHAIIIIGMILIVRSTTHLPR